MIIGVAGAGQEISTSVSTGDGAFGGSAFGGARGRTDVPKIVDWYMDGKINIDDLITHTVPLEDINKGFDLMHKGESIPCCGVLTMKTLETHLCFGGTLGVYEHESAVLGCRMTFSSFCRRKPKTAIPQLHFYPPDLHA